MPQNCPKKAQFHPKRWPVTTGQSQGFLQYASILIAREGTHCGGVCAQRSRITPLLPRLRLQLGLRLLDYDCDYDNNEDDDDDYPRALRADTAAVGTFTGN